MAGSIEELMARGSAMFVAKTLPATPNATLRRKGKSDLSVSVMFGESRFSVVSEDGVEVQYEMRDFFLLPSALASWGTDARPAEPERGDRVLVTIGGEARAYEALPDPIDNKAYRESDRYNGLLRVHTKRVKA